MQICVELFNGLFWHGTLKSYSVKKVRWGYLGLHSIWHVLISYSLYCWVIILLAFQGQSKINSCRYGISIVVP
eukprot:UN20163